MSSAPQEALPKNMSKHDVKSRLLRLRRTDPVRYVKLCNIADRGIARMKAQHPTPPAHPSSPASKLRDPVFPLGSVGQLASQECAPILQTTLKLLWVFFLDEYLYVDG
jgi:hypothetical protein